MNDRRFETRPVQGWFARALSCALIFFVTYGAIVEVVHQHVVFSLDRPVAGSIGSTSNKDVSGHPQSSGECLICQLHQNLFNGLFHALPDTLPPPAVLSFAPTSTLSYFFPTDTPRRGRAPPITSLL